MKNPFTKKSEKEILEKLIQFVHGENGHVKKYVMKKFLQIWDTFPQNECLGLNELKKRYLQKDK